MPQAEMLYSASQVTSDLEMTPQMAGRYYQTFEKITKQKIKKLGRDGRQFDEATRQILLTARNIVRSSSDVTVEDAIKRALSLSTGTTLEPIEPNQGINLELLKAALAEAVAAPLVAEIRELRNSQEILRRELVELQAARENRETDEIRALRQEVRELRENNQRVTQQIEALKVSRIVVVPIDHEKEHLEQRSRELELELQMAERQNNELGNELEKRRLEAEAKSAKRPWWKLWP